jgi:hypothetical protein
MHYPYQKDERALSGILYNRRFSLSVFKAFILLMQIEPLLQLIFAIFDRDVQFLIATAVQ